MDDVSFNTSPPASPDEFYLYGTVKIQDNKTSTPDVVSWKNYKMVGWDLKKTDIEKNIKTKQTTYAFNGILTFGILEPINNPDLSYKITGSFQEPSGNLTFIGKETTMDDFFKERFGYK